jgi:uncharacterized phage protein (TIGR01671 family)
MREIKFRGMDANGIMRYGRISQDKPNETLYYKEYSQRICWDNSNIPVKNETVGQYTGLKDKNGKEIYEGDILLVKERDGLIISIHWDISSASWQFDEINLEFDDGVGSGNWDFNMSMAKMSEVIGNIYSNPELVINSRIINYVNYD